MTTRRYLADAPWRRKCVRWRGMGCQFVAGAVRRQTSSPYAGNSNNAWNVNFNNGNVNHNNRNNNNQVRLVRASLWSVMC